MRAEKFKGKRKQAEKRRNPGMKKEGWIHVNGVGGCWENNRMQERVSYVFYRRRSGSRMREECMKKE